MKHRYDLIKIKRNDEIGLWELFYDSKLISTSGSYKFLQKNTDSLIGLYKAMLKTTTKISKCGNDFIN